MRVPPRHPRLAVAVLGLLCAPAVAVGQTRELPPVGFRSGFTQGAGTIPTRTLVLQAGAAADFVADATTYQVGQVQVHIPLASRVEVQLAPNSLAWRTEGGVSTSWRADGSAGVLVQLTDAAAGRGWPTLSLAAATTLPTGTGAGHQAAWQPTVKLLAARPVGARTTLMTNVGYARPTEGGSRGSRLFATLWGHRGLTDRLGSYVEAYAATAPTPGAGSRVVAHGGLTYLVGTTHHLDVHVGAPVRGGDGTFVGLGIMQRF